MTSHDPEMSSSWTPIRLELSISKSAGDAIYSLVRYVIFAISVAKIDFIGFLA